MAVLRNRYPLNIPPSGADPLLSTKFSTKFSTGTRVVVVARNLALNLVPLDLKVNLYQLGT
jgi:hypothetical protein